MAINAESRNSVVAKGDTAELYAYLYDNNDQVVQPTLIDEVNFTVRDPEGVETDSPGIIQADGAGFLRWTDTQTQGVYVWVAQFTLTSGEKRSFRDDFVVQDLLLVPSMTQDDKIADQVWLRLEDCFDSAEGGPHLRDVTRSYFDKQKINNFVHEGLVYINNYPPITQADVSWFTTDVPSTDPVVLAVDPTATQTDPDQIVLVQATLLATIKHLMRSYVEQPNVVGANIQWMDRRDYLNRWQIIYQIEWDYFKILVALWKRQFFNYGRSALLVNNKAGRFGYYPGFRARNIGRGWY